MRFVCPQKKRAQNIVKQCTIRPAQIHGEEEMAGGVVLLADPITLELPEEEEGEESGAGGIDGCDPPIWYAFNILKKMKNLVNCCFTRIDCNYRDCDFFDLIPLLMSFIES